MSFEYKVFQQSHVISNSEEELVLNAVSAEVYYIRMIRLTNVGAGAGAVTLSIIPNVAGAKGALDAKNKIFIESLAVGDSLTVEFPIPGIILEYNDVLSAICDTADTINSVITGGRDY